MTTADRIKLERERRGWSQEYLAKLLGYSGKSTISKIETSGDKVTLKTIEKLASVFNCSKFYLMGIESSEPTDIAPDLTFNELLIEMKHKDNMDDRLFRIIENYSKMDDYFKDKMLSQSNRLLDTQKNLDN